MKLLLTLIFLIACSISCTSDHTPSQSNKEISESDSIEEVDTVQIQHASPPYDVEETIIKRKVPLIKNYIEKTETLRLQRPEPPYDYHDTIITTRIATK